MCGSGDPHTTEATSYLGAHCNSIVRYVLEPGDGHDVRAAQQQPFAVPFDARGLRRGDVVFPVGLGIAQIVQIGVQFFSGFSSSGGTFQGGQAVFEIDTITN